MTPTQLRDALTRLDLSQVAAARFCGVSERMVRRWIAGEYQIPPTVAMLLRLMIRLKLKPEDVK